MKKIILSISILIGFNSYSQNTIPTTTCTGALKINDSLNVNKDITALGDITSRGEVTSTDTLRAQKDILIDGNAKVGGDLTISGMSTFVQEIVLKKGLLFDNLKGISYTPNIGTTPNKFSYGNKVLGIPEKNCAAGPQPWANHQFGGMLQIYDANPITGDYIPNSGLLNFQTWTGGSSIDASVGGNASFTGKLLLNYFCGNDVSICQGIYGGIVGTGNNVEIGFPSTNLQTALNIGTQAGITKAITIFNPIINKEVFHIKSNGATYIGIQKPITTGPHANAMLAVDGKILAKEIYVNIHNSTWADYVFDKNYKLMPLAEVEAYVNKNKHLPNVPSGKDLTDTDDYNLSISDMQKIQMEKIEELYLYIFNQQKEIEALKKELKK